MKRIASTLLIFTILCAFTSCSDNSNKSVMLDNSSNSSFVDFYTEGDTVYIECELNIYNPFKDGTKIKIYATDNDDVKIGLLKNAELTGINKATDKETFTLKNGENSVTVLFTGDYAGIYQITNRDIPRFISIEKVR